jgi:non-ribosomal peptide synthase protein (TIGR01720 family)
VAAGIYGELLVGGDSLARGYLNRPDLTAERFIANPFSTEPGKRLYRTGDLVRWLTDGNIEFSGRIDNQVKVRGFRIEPGEIEVALAQHPQIRETVVVARADAPSGGRRLVAYLVPEPGQATPSVSELRQFLKGLLPDYMIPSAFVTLKELPLTASRKVDRQALPAPERVRPEGESDYVEPRNEVETRLAEIWSQLLGLEKVGVEDNFFELGGDSILSIQVVARANQAGVRLTPRQIFEHQTIAELALVAGSSGPVEAEQGPVEGPVPLTPIQRWFFEEELRDAHHWNQTLLFKVRPGLKAQKLRGALQTLIEHHDALRLRFEPPDESEGWRQINAGLGEKVSFVWVDLSNLGQEQQTQAVSALSGRLQASLNLQQGPLMRTACFERGEGRTGRLLMAVHHLAVDGISWRILLEDLERACLRLQQAEPVDLPPKTTSFKQWAERLQEHARSRVMQAEAAYWLAPVRKGVQAARLPVDFEDGINSEVSAASLALTLDERETQMLLQDVPQAYRTQINDVLMTALAQVLSRWAGAESVAVQLEGHGREELFEDLDISRTVGWFSSEFPVLLQPSPVSLGEALKSVKEQLRAVPRRGVGFGLLRYLCEPETASRMREVPTAQVSFNYLGQVGGGSAESKKAASSAPSAQSAPQPLFAMTREPSGLDRSPKARRSYLLDVIGNVAAGRLRVSWTFSQNVHRESTIRRQAEEYMQALRSLIAHCRSPQSGGYTPSDFPLASVDQQKLDKILKRFNKRGK